MSGGICVANHTSPIDIIILGCDNCYAMVGVFAVSSLACHMSQVATYAHGKVG